MSGSVNKAIVLGHLGKDPDVRQARNGGSKIVSFSVATSESWRDRNTGERKERTQWHNVVIYQENLCEIAEKYLRKGSRVYVEGQMQTRKWTDDRGVDRWSTEVVLQGFQAQLQLMDRAGSGYQPGGNGPEDHGLDPDRAAGHSAGQPSESRQSFARDMNDDIPF